MLLCNGAAKKRAANYFFREPFLQKHRHWRKPVRLNNAHGAE